MTRHLLGRKIRGISMYVVWVTSWVGGGIAGDRTDREGL